VTTTEAKKAKKTGKIGPEPFLAIILVVGVILLFWISNKSWSDGAQSAPAVAENPPEYAGTNH
jgi:hypothetical protein